MNHVAEDILMHYGVAKRSGRYPWGSGDNPYQHSGDFLSRVEELRKENFTYTDANGKKWTGDNAIAKSMGLTSSQFRTQVGLAKGERRQLEVARVKSLSEDGLSNAEIGRIMGKNESTIRSLKDSSSEARMNQAQKTAEFIKKQIDEKGIIDVGTGVERELNISKEKLGQALYILEMEGYPVYGGGVSQVTNKGQQTNLKVICPPGTEHKDIYNAFDEGKVHSVRDYISRDGGETYEKAFEYPASMDSKRLKIRYAEEGGTLKDGVVELRRGVDDLSLGESRYSQVRILVDGDRYIKGMAVYSDNMPDGVDVIFNTNKKAGTPVHDVLKKIKDDPDNPFGSAIKEHGGQYHYIDKDGKEKLGLINKRADEGDWSDWKDKLPSQFLSKQNLSLAKKQLGLAAADKQAEYDEICALSNPTVKKALLKSFSDDCDSAAVHLYAAALPRQKYQVILPVSSMKDNEVYAPNFNDGESVALIRYPHGGTFEIPILTVNNKQRTAKSLLGSTPTDAIAINSKIAERLSGADFDGDTVMVIPTSGNGRNSKVKITSTPPLKGLEGFDPKTEYGPDSYKGRDIKKMKNTQTEMGKISNLITDMTLKGATTDELAKAVRHSMVVIDAEKHGLDYKKSEADNDIAYLKKKYQGAYDENGNYHTGASTLISRAKSEVSVPKRQGTPKINEKGKDWYDPSKPEGALLFKTSDDLYYQERYTKDDNKGHKKGDLKYNEDGTPKMKSRTQQSTKMYEADDAYSLISDANTPMEIAYADYANKMKALGNQARKEMISTGKIEYSASAKAAYQKEVDSLEAALNIAEKNAPRERQAQVLANAEVKAKIQANPGMKPDEVKKISQQALIKYRNQVGAKSKRIEISDKEWEAIQAGAISESKLIKILNHADMDIIKQKATPRATTSLNQYKINRINSMNASGNYSTADIAEALGVSTSVVSEYLKGKE